MVPKHLFSLGELPTGAAVLCINKDLDDKPVGRSHAEYIYSDDLIGVFDAILIS